MLKPLAAQHHAVLTLTTDSTPVLARVDTGQMQQIVINLVTNAWQAMPAGGRSPLGSPAPLPSHLQLSLCLLDAMPVWQ